jgi:hypothetical protein
MTRQSFVDCTRKLTRWSFVKAVLRHKITYVIRMMLQVVVSPIVVILMTLRVVITLLVNIYKYRYH